MTKRSRRKLLTPKEFDAEIERIRKKIGASSNVEVVRRALRLREMVVLGKLPLLADRAKKK